MTLEAPPKFFRGPVARGLKQLAHESAPRIDREGGDFGQGIIRGVSVITRGEALGHEMWVDEDFVESVAFAINNSPSDSGGVKARFTHPGMSADGMANHLGRLKNAGVVNGGRRVIADLHFNKASHNTPDGDLATYVMDLAEETPDAFGLSISFEHDMEASEALTDENTTVQSGREIFVSPDEENKDNYIHARLQRLYAGDVVDEPAANPAGLFSLTSIPEIGDDVLKFVFGLTSEKPEALIGGFDAERIKGFAARFFDRHRITFSTGEKDMAEETVTREDLKAESARYVEAFGEVNGPKWFLDGLSFEEAQTEQIKALSQANEDLAGQVKDLNEKLEAIDLGEEHAASHSGPQSPAKPEKKKLQSRVRISGKSYDEN